ncbi:hypothetical protein BJV82DRAFT_613066 [Fennellomyces sp. T-0311]|nr:hypothetical protein BJV82DRAFT_613066 [Fennellomyces sp. T-0311]
MNNSRHNQLRFQYNQCDNVRDQRMNLTLAENVERRRREYYSGWKTRATWYG